MERDLPLSRQEEALLARLVEGRANVREERKAQRTMNPQTQCPDDNGELGTPKKMSSEDNETNGRQDDEEDDEDRELEEETEDE